VLIREARTVAEKTDHGKMAIAKILAGSGDQTRERIFANQNARGPSRRVLTEFQNFAELRQGNHPEMHHSDTALFRLPQYGFISFYVNSENSEILSTWSPYLESNGSPLSTIQCTAFPNLIAMRNLAWGGELEFPCPSKESRSSPLISPLMQDCFLWRKPL